LLKANYKNGDGKRLSHLLNKAHNIESIHRLSESYIKIYDANKARDCKIPLVDLYDKVNCAICRKDIVEIMIKNKVLPSKINKEIQFDSCLEIRKLYRSKV
jgi:hypothetical protein